MGLFFSAQRVDRARVEVETKSRDRKKKKKNGYESVSENRCTQLSWVPNSRCVIVARAACSNRSV
jgi:hypothetical protein